MGEARRKRRMVQKAERKVAESSRSLDKITAAQEENWTALEKMRKDFDEISAEYQEQLWAVCDVAGPEFFPRDSKQVARLYLDTGIFDRKLGENIPEEIETKVRPRLAYLLQEYMHDKTGRLSQGLQIMHETAKAQGETLTDWNIEYVKQLFGSIYSQRMIHEKSAKAAGHFVPFTKLDWKKHMLPTETMKYGKKTLEEFLHSHEAGLTGRALRAKELLDALPEAARKEMMESFKSDEDGDYADIEKKIIPAFSALYPTIEPLERSKAFMDLFGMVQKEMKDGKIWVDEDGAMEEDNIDGVAYMVAERIFLKGYDHAADREFEVVNDDDDDKKTPFQIFMERLKEQELALIGEAASARDQFLALPEGEQQALIKFVDNAPKNVRDAFTKAIDEFLSLRKEGRGSITVQLLFDSLLPIVTTGAGFDREKIREDLLPILTYILSEKILRQGFLEAQDQKASSDVSLAPTELWTDSEITQAGVTLWERTYKIGGDDHDVVREARRAAESWGEVATNNGVLVNESRIAVAEAVFGFTAKWAVHAFQRITTTHTYAAALMCTDASRDVLQDIEMQWHAFMVCLPNGLLTYYDDELKIESEYSRILVASFSHAASLILLNQNGGMSKNRLVVQVGNTMADVLDVDSESKQPMHSTEDVSTGTHDKVRRVFILAKRLVVGLLLALQNQNNFKSRLSPARDGKKPREREEPAHRVVFIGSPLKVDCRPQVKDYIANGSHKRKGAPPAVQYLVRGHHKRQVVGVGRLGRKVIWVEPYWKGDEDAPIFTRPKLLKGK